MHAMELKRHSQQKKIRSLLKLRDKDERTALQASDLAKISQAFDSSGIPQVACLALFNAKYCSELGGGNIMECRLYLLRLDI